jgi:hypothetical protein
MPAEADRRANTLLSCLYRQGAYRWLGLIAAVAVLSWLWLVAGQVRQEGRAKRQWAVLASRLLVLAGGVIAAKLLLISHEERIPVLYLKVSGADATGRDTAEKLRLVGTLQRRGYEDVPLSDIVMSIRENRYVPKRGMGLVVEVPSLAAIGGLVDLMDGLNATLVLPLDALRSEDKHPADGLKKIPSSVRLAPLLKPGQDADRGLKEAAGLILNLTGRSPECVLMPTEGDSDVRRILKANGYECVLDGKGFNRFGDDPYMIRLFDVTTLAGARAAALGLLLYISLFRGTYVVWPLTAIAHLLKALPGRT